MIKKRKCEWCGKNFTMKHPHQKYCCQKHALYGKMEKKNIRNRKYYKKHKSVIKQEKQYKDLGSGYLYSTPKEKEKDEIEAIQREKQRLGLCI